MNNYRQSLEHQLRLTMTLSGGCAPNAVGGYLKDLARKGSDKAKQQIYDDFAPLVETVPATYADFLLEILLQRRRPPRWLVERRSSEEGDDLRDSADHFASFHHDYYSDAPTYDKGPFLYLLRQNEDEGLRFVWTYSNTLTDRWRREVARPHGYQKQQPPRTPLPLELELSSGTLSFWGDEGVYLWPHDRNRYSPRPLVSTLLALEYWIEEQIESGREVWPLIEKVLSGSRCVAVLGLCFGVMIAYMERVWDQVLPFLKCARLWCLEHARFQSQQVARAMSGYPQGQPFERSELKNRSNRPQRWQEIRDLAMSMELSDDPRKGEYEAAVLRFPSDPLPFAWAEEADDALEVELLRERMEEFAAFANRHFYQFRTISEEVTGVKVILPPHIEQARRERYAFLLEPQEAMGITSWALKGIENRTVPNGRTLEEAVALVRALARPDDFSYAYEWRRDVVNTRHEAQVAVAALLVVAAWQWACDTGHAEWCLGILKRATDAPLPYDAHENDGPAAIFSIHPKTFAAHGWGALAARADNHDGMSDLTSINEIRANLFQLVQLQDRAIWEAVFRELTPLWNAAQTPAWLWSLLYFAVMSSVAVSEEGDSWLLEASRIFQSSVVEDNPMPSKLPPFPATSHPTRTLTDVLEMLPLEKLGGGLVARNHLVELVHHFVSWLVSSYSNEHPRRRSQLSRAGETETFDTHDATEVLKWCVAVSDLLDVSEAQHLLVNPIWKVWSTVPGLTEELLHAHINHWIRSESLPSATTQHTWRTLSLRVLESPEIKTVSRWSPHRNIEAAIDYIVFQWAGSCWLTPPYPHASCFMDIFGVWVERVGYREMFFPKLLKLLEAQRDLFCPHPMLEWLAECFEHEENTIAHSLSGRTRDADEILGRVSRLVHRAFVQMKDEMVSDEPLRRMFLFLLEPLIRAGNTSAAWMREQMTKM